MNAGLYRKSSEFHSKSCRRVHIARAAELFLGPSAPIDPLPAAAAIGTSTLEGVLPPGIFAAMANDATVDDCRAAVLLNLARRRLRRGNRATYVLPAEGGPGSYTGFHQRQRPLRTAVAHTPWHHSASGRRTKGGSAAQCVTDGWRGSCSRDVVGPVRVRRLDQHQHSAHQQILSVPICESARYDPTTFGGDLLGRRALET